MQEKSRKRHSVFIGLGSNTGDSHARLFQAVDLMENELGPCLRISSIYETEPWGEPDQENFHNAVCLFYTDLEPLACFSRLVSIEQKMGKSKLTRWGPRTIDLDILFYGQKIIVEKDLIIPHPNMYLRNFVLTPLAEIAPDFVHPILKKTTKSLLEGCPDKTKVEKIPSRDRNINRKEQ
jgi:2-amino-4-hydroxy-6-hydroxymethyldihydropteridine diphosphokinase